MAIQHLNIYTNWVKTDRRAIGCGGVVTKFLTQNRKSGTQPVW